MEPRKFPVLEFDPDLSSVIQAKDHYTDLSITRRCVFCFFAEAIEKTIAQYPSEIVGSCHSESFDYPIYALEYKGEKILLVRAGIGAPTGAAQMEELYAMGCDIFVACGSCGVIQPDIVAGHLIVPTAAVRDEGTSYHYAPPSREIEADRQVADVIAHTIQAHDIPYLECKTWSTDAFYRETRARVDKRRAEGCVTVEMECSAYIAVSRYLGAKFGQILYAGDDLTGEKWDKRNYSKLYATRELVLDIALDACLNIR